MSSAEPARQSPDLSFLPALVREPRRPLLTILVCWLMAIGGALLIAAIVRTIVTDAESPDFSWLIGKGFITVFVLAIATPLIETLILAGTTSILLRFVKPQYAILISSLGWALAHSNNTRVWGLVIFWPFIIFTTLYVVWKQRSLVWGIAMPWAVHGMQNLFPAIAIGYPGLFPVQA